MSIYNLAGVPIFYESYGAGPDLVFLHGYTCNMEDWRWTADQLADSFRVLLFDFRCHGHSGKNVDNLVLKALTDETHRLLLGLGRENPILIGHSMGGMIALDYGLRFPQSVRALVLAETHTHLETTARLIGSAVLDERTPPDIALRIIQTMAQGEKQVSEDLFKSLLAFDVRGRIPELKMPVLLLWGDRYGDIQPAQWSGILSAFGFKDMPNVRVEYIANAHHFIMLERPQDTLLAIQQFLKTL